MERTLFLVLFHCGYILFEYYFLRPHLDLETDYGVGGIRHRGFYPEAVGLFLDSYLPAVGQACNGFHLAAVQALDSEGLAVPTENEGVNEAVLTGETDIPFDGSLIGACAIDAFPVCLQPFADLQQYLLLIFGDGAVALGRNIQTEVATAGYVIDEIADDAIGILQFQSFYIAELVANGIVHLPVAAVWLARCTALTLEVNDAPCQIGLTL